METKQPAPKFKDASIAPMHTAEHILNQTMIRLFGCVCSYIQALHK